jgi:hypothetical protein
MRRHHANSTIENAIEKNRQYIIKILPKNPPFPCLIYTVLAKA